MDLSNEKLIKSTCLFWYETQRGGRDRRAMSISHACFLTIATESRKLDVAQVVSLKPVDNSFVPNGRRRGLIRVAH